MSGAHGRQYDPFLLFRADYGSELYQGEYFLMSSETERRKFASFLFSVCLREAGGRKMQRSCRSYLISAVICEEQPAAHVSAEFKTSSVCYVMKHSVYVFPFCRELSACYT